MRFSHQRRGFTLYQLLALIAIIAILAAFLLPAVQKVRQAAARTESQNNLKQLMLACHDRHAEWNRLPSGNDANNFSGLAHLLPYIEQVNIFNRIDFKQDSTAKANAQMRSMMIKVFHSPLDPVQRVSEESGPTNYFLNAGTQASLAKGNGPFYQNSRLTLNQITNQDGSSNTIGIVEALKGAGSTQNPTVQRQHILLKAKELAGLKANAGVDDFRKGKNLAGNRGESWMDGRFLMSTMNAGRKINDPRPDVSCEGQGGWSAARSLSENVQVGMCDGSVRNVNSKISFQTWQNASSYNDGMVLGNDW